MKKLIAVIVMTLVLCNLSLAQKSSAKKGAPSGVDKAYLQQIWDGWGKLDPSKQAQYYAKGVHTFFDITPLKYAGWDEYQVGVAKALAGYKAADFVVNDDAQSHAAGDVIWGTATVKYDMTTTADKHEMGNMRWTYVFGKQDGKWVLIHEHVSMPLQ